MLPRPTPGLRVAGAAALGVAAVFSAALGNSFQVRMLRDESSSETSSWLIAAAVQTNAAVMLSAAVVAYVLFRVARSGQEGLQLSFSRRSLTAAVGHSITSALGFGFFLVAVRELTMAKVETLTLIGPFLLAMTEALWIGSNRSRAVIWPVLALLGIVFLWNPLEVTEYPVWHIGAALVTAGMWAASITLNKVLAVQQDPILGKAVAQNLTALLLLGVVVVSGELRVLSPGLLIASAMAGLLVSVIPSLLDIGALRILSKGTYGILKAMAPIIAGVIGYVALGQELSLFEGIGMVLFSIAVGGTLWVAGTREAEKAEGTVQ